MDKDYRFCVLAGRGRKANMDPEQFLKRMYAIHMGRELNLEHPLTYTEKLQWLKLYDHRPEYTTMVDKYAVKEYIAERIGQEYVVPLLGVWEKAEDIDFDSLPDQFVLKTTHDSGGIVVCKDKSRLDIPTARKKLSHFLKRNYYDHNREWPYKNVPHRIIAEKYMEDSRQGELRDYKFFTFGGVPKVLYIAQGRGSGGETVADFFDMEFNHLPFTIDHDMAEVPPEKPVCFEEMKRLKFIDDAEYIITDSFHACVFSILFNKPFVCIGNKSRGNARFDSLLGLFGLEFRLVEGLSDIEEKILIPIDWDRVNKILKEKRKEANEFIVNALNNEREP